MIPLTKPNPDRFVLFPIQYPQIWEFYQQAEKSFWTAKEIQLADDVAHHWPKLTDGERHFISHVIAFFAASDGIVNENLAVDFLQQVQIPEARSFYGFQIMMENIHSETYSLMLDAYITDEHQKMKLLRAHETIPAIKKKADWALRWISAKNTFVERLAAFSAVEGIFFSSSFCSIFWLNKRGLMPGLSQANQFISRDEGLHCDFALYLLNNITTSEERESLRPIYEEAIALEKEFAVEALPVSLIGMNADMMSDYIQFVGNRLLQTLGLEVTTPAQNPFSFMDMLGMPNKTNFFEHTPTEYQKTSSSLTSFDELD